MRYLILITLALGACAATPDRFLPAEIRPVETTTHAARHQGASIDLGTAEDLLGKDPKAAFEAYQAAWLIDPLSRPAQIGMARSALAMGATRRAEAILARMAPGPDRADLDLVVVAMSGTADDPELALNAALEVDFDNPDLWRLLAREYRDQGRIAESLDAAIRAKSLG